VTGTRARVAAALAPAFVHVIAYPRDVDQVQDPTAVVVVESVDPPSVACPAPVVTLSVWVVTPLTEPGPADDAADTLLDAALSALTGAGITWTTAERAVWRDRNPAYRVTIEI
jgi:hypothetical protein